MISQRPFFVLFTFFFFSFYLKNFYKKKTKKVAAKNEARMTVPWNTKNTIHQWFFIWSGLSSESFKHSWLQYPLTHATEGPQNSMVNG